MTYQSKYPVIHMFWQTEVLCVIMVSKQVIIIPCESLAACENANSKLPMYFTLNTAFANYLDRFPNLTESHEFPVIKNRTTFEQNLPISLNISKFDKMLLTASTDLKDTPTPTIKKFLICEKGLKAQN